MKYCYHSTQQAGLYGTSYYLIDGKEVLVSEVFSTPDLKSNFPDAKYLGMGEYSRKGMTGSEDRFNDCYIPEEVYLSLTEENSQ